MSAMERGDGMRRRYREVIFYETEYTDLYESCCDCIHDADTEEICRLRNCIHAVHYMKDCFEPKKVEDVTE